MSSDLLQFAALEYREAGAEPPALAMLVPSEAVREEEAPVMEGVPEQEVERRVRAACEAAVAECQREMRAENERQRRETQEQAQQRWAETLRSFEQERANYFRRVEGEVVRLSLAIARKILEREATLDPMWVAALVRIALDRMESGSPVRIHVAPAEVERWQQIRENAAGGAPWEIVADDELKAGDCVVETEMGRANFGFEAQLCEVEESFEKLLAHRPEGV